MSYVTYINESFHKCMGYVTHMNERICERVTSHVWKSHHTYVWGVSHTWVSAHINDSCHAWIRAHTNESRRMNESSHIGMGVSHTWICALMNDSCHAWIRAHTNESRHTYEWVIPHRHDMRRITHINPHTYERFMSRMNSRTYERVTSHVWMSHHT